MTPTVWGRCAGREGLAETLAAKQTLGLGVSVCLPARDEEATIGPIVESLDRALVRPGLVDEVLVIDDGSRDTTAGVAAAAGARVVPEATSLVSAGPGSGKGNALWKSLHESRGDLVCWIDADVANFSPDFVTSLLRPLLLRGDLVLSKATYRRSLHGRPDEGGRVTELTARPLLSLFFPELADLVQPLAGEYAGRRRALETVPFVQGWGVEIGLLIDLARQYGAESIAQVDLGRREHRNRPLVDLGPQALAVIVTALRRAGVDVPELAEARSVELRRPGAAPPHDLLTVETRERPALIDVAEYRTRHHR